MKWILGTLLATLGPAPAMAWGDQGHSLTCQIAYDLLTPTARSAVDALLQHQDSKYRNFANACTYADDVKDFDGRRSQHFVNLDRTATALGGLSCPVASTPTDCLLAAIREDYDILKSGTDEAARSKALLYLGHWIGDLHQPLHISFKDDLGGNDIRTSGYCGSSKLHAIWDTCMIVQKIYATTPGVAMIDDPRFRDKAQELADAISASEKAAWLTGEPWQWANESFVIARKPKARYCTKKSGACWYDSTRKTFSGTKRTVQINDAYLAEFAPVVRKRLQMGGARLAFLLNRALDPAHS